MAITKNQLFEAFSHLPNEDVTDTSISSTDCILLFGDGTIKPMTLTNFLLSREVPTTYSVTDASGGGYGLKITNSSTFSAVAAHKAIQCELTHTPSSAGTACPISIVGKLSVAGDNTASNSYPGMGFGVQGQLDLATSVTIDDGDYGNGAIYSGLRGAVTGGTSGTFTKGHVTCCYLDMQAVSGVSDNTDFMTSLIYANIQQGASITDVDYGLWITANTGGSCTALKTGISIDIPSTTGISLSGTATTGISISGATTNAISVTGISSDAMIDVTTTGTIGSYGIYVKSNCTGFTGSEHKGLYVRAESVTNSAATKSLYGAMIYGTANAVTHTTGSLWGLFSYAYVKGDAAQTINNIYAHQAEFTMDASRANDLTITTEAAVILAKVTAGKMADDTKLNGMIIRLGDMDGHSATFGTGILIEDDAGMSGTCGLTTGINLTAGTTTGINISGATTTAIQTSGTSGSAAGRVLKGVMTVNNGNYGDGYALTESELTLTGTDAGHVAALSSWVNMATGTHGAGGNFVAAQTNGIWTDSGATIDAANIIFGMRAQCLCQTNASQTNTKFFPFSIVSNTNAITSVIQCNAASTDLGAVSNAGSDDSVLVPLYEEGGGANIGYIKIYSLA